MDMYGPDSRGSADQLTIPPPVRSIGQRATEGRGGRGGEGGEGRV